MSVQEPHVKRHACCMTVLPGQSPAATAQFRVKFHLQADILRALCDGVEIETAFVDSIKAFAPRHLVPLCGAALTLAVARRRSLSGGDGRESLCDFFFKFRPDLFC